MCVPFVRGKVTADVEFGAKVAICMVDGYAFVETLIWDAFNEDVTCASAIDITYDSVDHGLEDH